MKPITFYTALLLSTTSASPLFGIPSVDIKGQDTAGSAAATTTQPSDSSAIAQATSLASSDLLLPAQPTASPLSSIPSDASAYPTSSSSSSSAAVSTPSSNSTVPGTTTFLDTSATTSTAPTASCNLQDGTPEQPRGCVCSSSSSTITVSALSIASATDPAQSCGFSTFPGSSATVTAPPQTVSTNLAGCEICTQLGPNEDNCTPLPSSLKCTPATTATTVSAATSPVSVGTLTGTALSAAITKAIDSLCTVPTAGATGKFTCDQTKTAVVASNIANVENGGPGPVLNTQGTLTLQITASNYDSRLLYDKAKTAVAALAQNSTQGNCKQVQTFTPTVKIGGFGLPGGGEKQITTTLCTVGNSYQYIEADPSGTPQFQELQYSLTFSQPPVDKGDLSCEFLILAAGFVEVAINVATDTEGAIPAEIKIDKDLLDACKKAQH